MADSRGTHLDDAGSRVGAKRGGRTADIPAANLAIVGSAGQIAVLEEGPVETVAFGVVAGEFERFVDGFGGRKRGEGLRVEDVDDAGCCFGGDDRWVLGHKPHSRWKERRKSTCSHHHHDRCAVRFLAFQRFRRKGTLCIRQRTKHNQSHSLL